MHSFWCPISTYYKSTVLNLKIIEALVVTSIRFPFHRLKGPVNMTQNP